MVQVGIFELYLAIRNAVLAYYTTNPKVYPSDSKGQENHPRAYSAWNASKV